MSARENNGKSVLILGGEARSALATARALGRSGFIVSVASHEKKCLSFGSRYVFHQKLSPNPETESAQYKKWLLELLSQLSPTFLLPVTDLTLELTLQLEEEIRRRTILPFSSHQTISQINDKSALLHIASSLGVKVPHSILLCPYGTNDPLLQEQLKDFPFPACLKASRSQNESDGTSLRPPVFYPNNAAEVIAIIKRKEFAHIPFLLQQRILGVGEGVFLLAANGDVLASFAHRRILEKPPQGGVSVLSESIALPEKEYSLSQLLCKHFAFSGVMMVEFKRTAEGDAYLMEINPRFWGSLQLAIDCGVDFPTLLLSTWGDNHEQKHPPQYFIGKRLRWTIGLLDHLLIRLRTSNKMPLPVVASEAKQSRTLIGNMRLLRFARRPGLPARNDRDSAFIKFLSLMSSILSARDEIVRTDDLNPALTEIRSYFISLLKRFKRKTSKSASPRRILFFIESGGPGGAERVVLSLVKGFQDRGYEILVATFRTGWFTDQLKKDSIEHILIESRNKYDLTLPFRISSLLKERKIDLLHSHLFDANFYGALGAKLAGVSHVATEHGDVHHIQTKRFFQLKLAAIRLLASKVTAVSQYTKDKLSHVGFKEGSTVCIYNPVPSFNQVSSSLRQKLGINESTWVWLHAANFRPVKDQSTLLQAFSLACTQNTNQLLLLAGDGPENHKLRDLVSALQLGEKVLFLGFREDLPELLHAADGFVLSSLSEAMPMSLLEAASAGLFIVSTDVGGIKEVITNNQTGLLVPPKSPEALSHALLYPLTHKEEAAIMSKAAQQYILKHFSKEIILSQYEKLYQGITGI